MDDITVVNASLKVIRSDESFLPLGSLYVASALENAGYDPFTYEGLIGLYAGASPSIKWEALTFVSGKSRE